MTTILAIGNFNNCNDLVSQIVLADRRDIPLLSSSVSDVGSHFRLHLLGCLDKAAKLFGWDLPNRVRTSPLFRDRRALPEYWPYTESKIAARLAHDKFSALAPTAGRHCRFLQIKAPFYAAHYCHDESLEQVVG